MNTIDKLHHLAPVADEMLAGLQADESMRLRIMRAAREEKAPRRMPARRFVPAAAMAMALAVCVGAVSLRLNAPDAPDVAPVQIEEIAAGEMMPGNTRMIADLGEGANVTMGKATSGSLFAQGGAEIPVVTLGGRVYRMLGTPQDIGASLLGGKTGSVQTTTDQPSLASDAEMKAGLSNVAAQSAAIYSVGGLSTSTAVAAEVNGAVRLFQRVSYAGKGPSGESFEDTFAVRGKVKAVELSGVGALTGSAANDVINVLLDRATLAAADAGAGRQFLTVTLDSGLKLQLGVSGDMVTGCGGWSCPEFFEAFEAAL